MNSLGHSSLPPTTFCRQDDEEATPGHSKAFGIILKKAVHKKDRTSERRMYTPQAIKALVSSGLVSPLVARFSSFYSEPAARSRVYGSTCCQVQTVEPYKVIVSKIGHDYIVIVYFRGTEPWTYRCEAA
ncbi:hypothetical protein TNCV_1956321 [Trichonephila clavipes]|nr:hypothetical protein TNCV_1956321 [Trichonephila clavipes]